MPIPLSTIFAITQYNSPSRLLAEVETAFRASEREANTTFPHALKCLEKEKQGEHFYEPFWIICKTGNSIDFVLSCTKGPLGDYPIFIFATSPYRQLLDESYVLPRIQAMVSALFQNVPRQRVFSIFAATPITQAFTKSWTELTGIAPARDPIYYDAIFTYCTKATLRHRELTLVPGLEFVIRPATQSDLIPVAELCRLFAGTSPPFTLTCERSLEEADLLIRGGQIWVHAIKEGNGMPEIASIAAFTRVSGRVATITKVYTNPKWRKRGCADRLVRAVTRELLKTKEWVVLYVGVDNPAAKVYNRVGFVGLDGNASKFPGVDSWLEIGFDRSAVELGHW